MFPTLGGGWLSRVLLPSKCWNEASSESSESLYGPFDSKKWLRSVTVPGCPYPSDKRAEILLNCGSFHQMPHLGTQLRHTAGGADPALALVSLGCPGYHPRQPLQAVSSRAPARRGGGKYPGAVAPAVGVRRRVGDTGHADPSSGISSTEHHLVPGSAAGKRFVPVTSFMFPQQLLVSNQ